MGSFEGHALPGTLFFLFGLCHTVAIYRRYFKALYSQQSQQSPNRYLSKASLTLGRLPVEGALKLLASGAGIAAEFITGFPANGAGFYASNQQHITMYSFFLLSGVADLMVHYGVHGLPDQLDYAAALLALSVEGFLFRWHQHGHSPIESMVHTYLVYAVGLCVVSGALEMMRPTDVRPSLARAAFLMLQGTWFWHIGFILYPPFEGMKPLSPDSMRDMMFVTNTFAWHVGAVALFSFAIGASVYRCVKMANGGKPLPSSRIQKSAGNHEYKPVSANNGGSIVLEFSDEDDEDDNLSLGVIS